MRGRFPASGSPLGIPVLHVEQQYKVVGFFKSAIGHFLLGGGFLRKARLPLVVAAAKRPWSLKRKMRRKIGNLIS